MGVLTFLMDAISRLSTTCCFTQPSSMAMVDEEHGEEEDDEIETLTSSFSDELLQRLPEDVVVKHIFDRLDYATRVRLSAVSRSWRRVSGLSPPPLDMPWLVLKTDWRSSVHFLHNLNLNTTHPPRAGGIPNYLLPGGSHGQYLVLISRTLKRGRSMLCNPFTGDCTALPSWYEARGRPARELHRLDVAQLSCAPSSSNLSNGRCVVAALDLAGNLYICRPRDSYWIRLNNTEGYLDMLFYKNELYCITRAAQVVAVPVRDINTAHPRLIIKGKEYFGYNIIDNDTMIFKDYYLVESCRELLVVTRYQSEMGCWVLGDRLEGIGFSVQRVAEEEGEMVQVDDLGDRMLFVQSGSSKSWSGLGQPAFFEKNCIYFVWKMERQNSCFCLGKFSLSTEGEAGSSFVVLHPNPFPSLFPPIWITPNPSST